MKKLDLNWQEVFEKVSNMLNGQGVTIEQAVRQLGISRKCFYDHMNADQKRELRIKTLTNKMSGSNKFTKHVHINEVIIDNDNL